MKSARLDLGIINKKSAREEKLARGKEGDGEKESGEKVMRACERKTEERSEYR